MSFWQTGRRALARALRLDLTHAQEHYSAKLAQTVPSGARWLDIGCGRQIVPWWAMSHERQAGLAGRASLLVGIDVDFAIREHPLLHARAMALGENLPFADRSFDLVTANMVFEHLPDPPAVLAEIRRVLKPGGRLIFLTPNYHFYMIAIASVVPDWLKTRIVWLLEKRAEHDIFPAHYRINTTAAVRRWAGAANLEVEDLRVVGSVGSFGMLGPLGWLECFPLKFVASFRGGELNVALLAALRRPLQP